MTIKLLLATDGGLFSGHFLHGSWSINQRYLASKSLTCVATRGSSILAGSRNSLYRSPDGGLTWQELADELDINHMRWLAYHPDEADLAVAGTEPAGILLSRDGGRSWHERPEVSVLRERHGWFLPYSPEAGCVRGFAMRGRRLYASVEVGGLLVSDDLGDSWALDSGSDGRPVFGQPPAGQLHPDVHSIELHMERDERLYAPTGGGFFTSADGGRSWQQSYRPCYCRAVWVDPGDADHLVLGPADSVDRNGRIEESMDGGLTWLAHEAPDAPWPRHMVERFCQAGDQLLAVLSNGTLLAAAIGEWRWRPVFAEAGSVRAIASIMR